MTSSFRPSIQLYYAPLELLADKSFSTQILGWLSAEERERYQRFKSLQQANQFLLARALLRSQLSKRVAGVLPSEWVFVVDENGKPRLGDDFSYLNFHFNLSHSEDLVVLALAGGLVKGLSEVLEVGVDVESIQRPIFNMALAKHYFAKSEYVDLLKLNQQQQIKRIAQLWTLKESLLKASGLGIRVPLAQLVFSYLDEGALKVELSQDFPQISSSPISEFISLFRLGADYSLALTLNTTATDYSPEIRCYEWEGLNGQPSGLICELLRKNYA